MKNLVEFLMGSEEVIPQVEEAQKVQEAQRSESDMDDIMNGVKKRTSNVKVRWDDDALLFNANDTVALGEVLKEIAEHIAQYKSEDLIVTIRGKKIWLEYGN